MLLQHTLRISLIWHIEVTRINLGLHILRIATIDSATHSIASTKNLFDGAFEFFSTAFEAHLASNVDDGRLGQIARVLNVLGFFLRSRRGSFNALMTRLVAFGSTSTFAARFWMVSFTVTRMPFHALVFFTISSPIFLGDIPKGPTFGANTDDGACSPPY